ncbi:hypothetical protein EK904_001750, partial [Melospiza melodia maxima]
SWIRFFSLHQRAPGSPEVLMLGLARSERFSRAAQTPVSPSDKCLRTLRAAGFGNVGLQKGLACKPQHGFFLPAEASLDFSNPSRFLTPVDFTGEMHVAG